MLILGADSLCVPCDAERGADSLCHM